MAKTFEELCRVEPALRDISERCAALPDGVCPVTAWSEEGGIKDEVRKLVGYDAANTELRNSEDYDVAVAGTNGRLPYCGRRCPLCGGVVRPEDTFTGVAEPHSIEEITVATAASYPTLQMLPSWALLVDFLGFSSQVVAAASEGRSQAHLAEMDQVVRETYGFLRGHNRWALKFFSDNVLVGCPVYDDGESEAGDILRAVCDFQLSLVLHGQFARGGLAIGELYMNPMNASGKALIDAHALDRAGTPPRIALSPIAKLAFAGYARYFDDEVGRFLAMPLLEDNGGDWFVDYLAPICGVRPYTGFDPTAIRRHRAEVERAMAANRENESILRKYDWLAGYHNDSVRQRTSDPELLIAGDFPEPPRIIGEESYRVMIARLSPDGAFIPPDELLRRAAAVAEA